MPSSSPSASLPISSRKACCHERADRHVRRCRRGAVQKGRELVSKIAMQTRLRRVARAVARWAVVLVLGGCSQVADGPSRSDTPEDPATFGPADPRADPTEETARAGEIVHTGQTIVVEPGAQVISNGTVSTGETSTAGMELAAIVKDGKAYLYHPALGNVPLSRETSLDALAYRFFRNQAVPTSRYAAAVRAATSSRSRSCSWVASASPALRCCRPA